MTWETGVEVHLQEIALAMVLHLDGDLTNLDSVTIVNFEDNK
jgi:hypothetical protein